MEGSLRRQRITGLLALVAFVAASWFFVLAPRVNQPAQVQEQADQLYEARAMKLQEIVSLERRQRYLAVAQQQVDSLGNKFPSSTDVPGLLAQVSLAASRAGLSKSQVQSITTGEAEVVDPTTGEAATTSTATSDTAETTDGSQSATMAVQITATGTSQELARFIYELQHMQRALAVDASKFMANAREGGGYGDSYTVSITGKAFLLSEIPPVPKDLILSANPATPAEPGSQESASASPSASPSASTSPE